MDPVIVLPILFLGIACFWYYALAEQLPFEDQIRDWWWNNVGWRLRQRKYKKEKKILEAARARAQQEYLDKHFDELLSWHNEVKERELCLKQRD